jgi:hypothetical protein
VKNKFTASLSSVGEEYHDILKCEVQIHTISITILPTCTVAYLHSRCLRILKAFGVCNSMPDINPIWIHQMTRGYR